MSVGRIDATQPSHSPAMAPAADPAVGVTANGRAFTTSPADPADRCGGVPNSRQRAALGRPRALDRVFRIANRLRGQQAVQGVQAAARRAAQIGQECPPTPSENGSARGSVASVVSVASIASGGIARNMPAPLRFLPMMNDPTLPPLVILTAQLPGSVVVPLAAHGARATLRALPWTQRLLSAVVYRLRYWTAPGEHRKALRLTHTRERVVREAYVFLNAMLSDEPLSRYFATLRRQVRRLDKRAGVLSGISDESARMLREAADRIARARVTAGDKILSFHREELLYLPVGSDEFHHADGVLLVLESRMATGIALYGQALRCIASIDVNDDFVCETIGEVLETVFVRETVFAREAVVGTMQPRDWLGCAVGRLPSHTLVRLYAVLSAGLACGGPYQAFLEELAGIVQKKVDALMSYDSSGAYAVGIAG